MARLKSEYLKYALPTEEAKHYVEQLFDSNNEMEEIFQTLQPLLFTISGELYGEDYQGQIQLNQLVLDFLDSRNKELVYDQERQGFTIRNKDFLPPEEDGKESVCSGNCDITRH